MKDELMPGKKMAAYWVEYVLRHNGAQHLRLNSIGMPFYQQYMLDVWLVFVSIVLMGVYATFIALRFLYRCCSRAQLVTKVKKH